MEIATGAIASPKPAAPSQCDWGVLYAAILPLLGCGSIPAGAGSDGGVDIGGFEAIDYRSEQNGLGEQDRGRSDGESSSAIWA